MRASTLMLSVSKTSTVAMNAPSCTGAYANPSDAYECNHHSSPEPAEFDEQEQAPVGDVQGEPMGEHTERRVQAHHEATCSNAEPPREAHTVCWRLTTKTLRGSINSIQEEASPNVIADY